MFSKKALTIIEQIEQLQQRGLHIPNPHQLARKYLSNISYYRLGDIIIFNDTILLISFLVWSTIKVLMKQIPM